MMRIEDFPRPKDDNGRGVHWSAILYHDRITPSLDYWIDELVAMKIKWVKLLDDGGGSSLELCRRLLAAGIMPIVRIYLQPANPNHLRSRELDSISRLIDIGVRYFESNNEPDLAAEWEDGHRPTNWLDIVVDNFIRDADAVLERGGLLALPAMGPGSKDNPISLVVAKGRKDLFERGCWVAIHNYTLNHPLDYPDDDVNQLGKPLTQEEYELYARWAYSHLSYDEIQARGIPISESDYHKFQNWAWGGRSLEMVNQLRAEKKNPGATVFDDPNCFRGWEVAGKMIYDALGFYVPVISTEGGPVVGWGDDLRYPKMNPQTQMEYQLEIVRFMQSQAPPWYFAVCTWLLATEPLGQINPTWEQMSWYTHAWDLQFGLNGQLPVVQALKDEPATVRSELQAGGGAIYGSARRRDGQPVTNLPLQLRGEGHDMSTTTDAAGAYRFGGLAAGTYSILSAATTLASDIVLAEDEQRQVDLVLEEGQQSTIEGVVIDTAGQPQERLGVTVGRGTEQVATVLTGEDGRYRVENLPAGSYWVITADGGAAVAGIRLDGWTGRTVDLTVPVPAGYRYVVIEKRLLSREETGNDRKFYGQVLDEHGEGLNGIAVEMAWVNAEPNTEFPRVVTPKDPFKPAGNFEFLHSPGEFILRVVQGDWPSDEADGLKTTGIPGREGDPITWEVNFQLQRVSGEKGSGRIAGTITNGHGLGLTLWRTAAQGENGQRSWAVVLPDDGRFAFQELPAGHYVVDLEGVGNIADLDLAEGASATVDYTVETTPSTGTLTGTLTHYDGTSAPGYRLLLYQVDTLRAQAITDAAGQFRFADLEPASYRLEAEEAGVLADEVTVEAGKTTTLTLVLPPPASGSTLSGRLAYSDGRPASDLLVSLVAATGETFSTVTADDGRFELSSLPAGTYDLLVEHPQQGQIVLQAGLVLDGRTAQEVAYTDLPPLTEPAKPLASYVLLGDTDELPLLLELLLPYLKANRLTAGFRIDEARLANQVIIVGDESVVSSEQEESLRQAGCQVERWPSDPFALAEALDLS